MSVLHHGGASQRGGFSSKGLSNSNISRIIALAGSGGFAANKAFSSQGSSGSSSLIDFSGDVVVDGYSEVNSISVEYIDVNKLVTVYFALDGVSASDTFLNMSLPFLSDIDNRQPVVTLVNTIDDIGLVILLKGLGGVSFWPNPNTSTWVINPVQGRRCEGQFSYYRQ